MQEACYCGRTGEIADREPVATDDGRQALRCPQCGRVDHLDWLPEDTRKLVVQEAEHKQPTAA